MPTFALILPAAGSSRRFGGPRSKLLEPLDGVPLIVRSLQAFLQRNDVASIIIPTNPDSDLFSQPHPLLQQALLDPRVKICPGGDSRAHSVRNALDLVPHNIEWVAVHDAARPLISQTLIETTLAAAVEHGAAVPALPVQLTIKQAIAPLPAKVIRTVPRHELWAMQTPQIMRTQALRLAFKNCPIPLDQVTDDVQLLELIGHEVWLVPGEEQNLKITRPLDLHLAQFFL